jgi:hypothetical protein
MAEQTKDHNDTPRSRRYANIILYCIVTGMLGLLVGIVLNAYNKLPSQFVTIATTVGSLLVLISGVFGAIIQNSVSKGIGGTWKNANRRLMIILSTLTVMFLTLLVLVVPTISNGMQTNATPQPTTPTTTNSTTTPISTSTPQAAFLYQADFSKGDQGWLQYAHSSQWSYNTKDKALESDGSLYCCDSSSISTLSIAAPYTMIRSDFAIEAKIRVTGINKSHPFTESDPDQRPFFGLYVRGDPSNQQGYKAGINGLPTSEPNAGAYTSFLAYGSKIPQGKIFHGKEGGGKDYTLDNNWHTYRLDVKGDTFMLLIDGKKMYSAPMQDDYFPSGPHIGLENYDFYLQVQSFTVTPL